MMRLAPVLLLAFGCSSPAPDPAPAVGSAGALSVGGGGADVGGSGGGAAGGGAGGQAGTPATIELDAPAMLQVPITAGAPVPFQLEANLCARLTGAASFHTNDSGYVVDGCQVFDNKQTGTRARTLIAEPAESGSLTVEVSKTDPWCPLSCAAR
jgi:hypothetical protein